MDYCTQTGLRKAIRQKKHQWIDLEEEGFHQLINQLEIQSVLEQALPVYRERVFTPTFTLYLFSQQVMGLDKSCRGVLMQGLAESQIKRNRIFSTNTAAYCKARYRLPEALIAGLARASGKYLHESSQEEWKWKGRNIKLVDGTTVSMPDTRENQKSYPQNSEQKPGLGFPIARIEAIICLASGALLDLSIGDYYSSEHSLLRKMLNQLSAGDVLLGDRYYCSYFLIAFLQRLNIDVVFRIGGNRYYDFRKGQRLGEGDHIVRWEKGQRPKWMDQAAYDELPETIYMREVKKGKTVVVTSLLDHKSYTRKEINWLYGERWQVELDLRSIKSVMGMSILRCKTPEMIRKEIWAFALAYNLIRLILFQSALFLRKIPRELSFKAAAQGIIYFYWILKVTKHRDEKQKIFRQLLFSIGQHSVGKRPYRQEPREVKRRPKTYKLLLKPRHLIKKRLLARR